MIIRIGSGPVGDCTPIEAREFERFGRQLSSIATTPISEHQATDYARNLSLNLPLLLPRDIEGQFYRAANLSQADLDHFIQKGVPQSALIHPDLLLKANVVFDIRDDVFDFAEPSDNAERSAAFIFLARNEFGEVADLIAWSPGAGRLACWLRWVPVLGAENIFWPRLSEPPALPVWRSPLDWLRAVRRGVVILNWRRAAAVLDGVGPLLAENAGHATELRRRLARRAPRVLTAPLGTTA